MWRLKTKYLETYENNPVPHFSQQTKKLSRTGTQQLESDWSKLKGRLKQVFFRQQITQASSLAANTELRSLFHVKTQSSRFKLQHSISEGRLQTILYLYRSSVMWKMYFKFDMKNIVIDYCIKHTKLAFLFKIDLKAQ